MHGASSSEPTVAPPLSPASILLTLAGLTALTPLATDMYIPAFPQMASDLSASDVAVQLSIAAYLFGLVLGQLLLGPTSDRFGRRGLLIAGAWLFALFSIGCAVAPTAEALAVMRVLQGAAGAAGMVLSRAMIGDWYTGSQAARYFSVLTMIFAIAPILAPVAGGLLISISSWRWIFAILAALGVVLAVAAHHWVTESLPVQFRHAGGLSQAFVDMAGLLRQRKFVGYVLTFACSTIALFSYLAGAPFIFQKLFGLSEMASSLLFGLNALGMLLGGAAFGALSHKHHLDKLLVTGVAIGLVAAICLLAFADELIPSLIALFVTMLGLGIVFPASMAAGQAAAPHVPGGASALLGAGQCLFGAATAPLVGIFGTRSAEPMAMLMVVGFGLAAAALGLLIQPNLSRN